MTVRPTRRLFPCAIALAIAAQPGCLDERPLDERRTGDALPPAEEPSPVEPVCGNGTLEEGEDCDDGNALLDDGCNPDCTWGPSEHCGDGFAGRGEECDDGNLDADDGCDPACRIEACDPDFDLGVLPVDETVTRLVDLSVADDSELSCGKGTDVVVSFTLEDAHDVRLDTGDSSATSYGVYREVGARCTTSPIQCWEPGVLPADGEVLHQLEAGVYHVVAEEGRPGSGGPAFVSLTALGDLVGCGNGRLEPGEACDDGNTESGDGCADDCRSNETCGNGIVDEAAGEECDEGDLQWLRRCTGGCRFREPQCRIDEHLGSLRPGVAVDRVVDLSEAPDDWLTTCGTEGRDRVFEFTIDRPGELWIRHTSDPGINIGLYDDSMLAERCQAMQGVCGRDQGRGRGGIYAEGIPPGSYFVVLEGDETEDVQRAHLFLWLTGCTPDEELGLLPRGEAVEVEVDTTEGNIVHDAGCGEGSGKERVVAFTLDGPTALVLEWEQTGDHVIGVMREAGAACDDSPVSCEDPVGEATGTTTVPRLGAGPYLLVIDAAREGAEGQVRIRLTAQ